MRRARAANRRFSASHSAHASRSSSSSWRRLAVVSVGASSSLSARSASSSSSSRARASSSPSRAAADGAPSGSANAFSATIFSAPAHVSRALASSMDWMPTLASLAGVRLPRDRSYDGRDLSAVLFGRARHHHASLLCFGRGPGSSAARVGRWKVRGAGGDEGVRKRQVPTKVARPRRGGRCKIENLSSSICSIARHAESATESAVRPHKCVRLDCPAACGVSQASVAASRKRPAQGRGMREKEHWAAHREPRP